MSRGLKILLALSILLNVFLVCADAAAFLKWRRLIDEGTLRQPTQLAIAARTLDPKVHADLRNFMRARSGSIRTDFDAARQDRIQAAALASKPTFDRAAVSALLAKARGEEATGHAKSDDAVLDYMVNMTPDQRAKLAQGLKARPHHLKRTITSKD
ncbi:MAG TPA: periplasmic heavy metal sensor [Caulobacteraceae bacterium]|jgi:uncharacterized membrane protein|nr:periplasmic heavy metal sensor [Caulobacteraceae bacterium]